MIRAAFNTFHTYVIQSGAARRLASHLARAGVGTRGSLPRADPLQPAATRLELQRGAFPETESQAQRILSLPVHQYLDVEAVAYVAACVEEFFADAA